MRVPGEWCVCRYTTHCVHTTFDMALYITQGTLVSGDAASSTHVPGSSHKAPKKSKGKKLRHGKAHNRAASPATPLAGHELDSLASPNSKWISGLGTSCAGHLKPIM